MTLLCRRSVSTRVPTIWRTTIPATYKQIRLYPTSNPRRLENRSMPQKYDAVIVICSVDYIFSANDGISIQRRNSVGRFTIPLLEQLFDEIK
jgi:hypothetical protein